MDNFHKAVAVQLLKVMQMEAEVIAIDKSINTLEKISNAIASISSKQSAMMEIMINILKD